MQELTASCDKSTSMPSISPKVCRFSEKKNTYFALSIYFKIQSNRGLFYMIVPYLNGMFFQHYLLCIFRTNYSAVTIIKTHFCNFDVYQIQLHFQIICI